MTEVTPKQVPFGQYEFVDVEFGPVNQDLVIPYQNLRVDDKDNVHWIDIRQGGLSDGTVALVYRVFDSPSSRFGSNYVVLRCNVAGYRTRLLLFTERI